MKADFYLIMTAIILIQLILYSMVRHTWFHGGVEDMIVLGLGIVISSVYCFYLGFDYSLFMTFLSFELIIWFRNPLMIVKGLMLISVIGMVTTTLYYTVLFRFWINNSVNSSYLLLSCILVFFIIEFLFKPTQRFFEYDPILSTQISAFLMPTTLVLNLFLMPSANILVYTFAVLSALLSFIIVGFSLYQAIVLNSYTSRHKMLTDTLLDDFMQLIANENSSRESIMATLSDPTLEISPQFKNEVTHFLGHASQLGRSNHPYINLVAYDLTKNYAHLNIHVDHTGKDAQVPLYCAWLEIIASLLFDQWHSQTVSILKTEQQPDRIVIEFKGAKVSSRRMKQLIAPNYFYFFSGNSFYDLGALLTVTYLQAVLKMSGHLYIQESNQIVFERKS